MNTSITCYTPLNRIAFSIFVAWAYVDHNLNQLIYCISILRSWTILGYPYEQHSHGVYG